MASILVIEGEQRIRESLETRLSERGHDVEPVVHALEGIEGAVSVRSMLWCSTWFCQISMASRPLWQWRAMTPTP
jgi:hypothetical protein